MCQMMKAAAATLVPRVQLASLMKAVAKVHVPRVCLMMKAAAATLVHRALVQPVPRGRRS